MPVAHARTICRVLLGGTSLLALAVTGASAEDFDASRLPSPADAKIVFSGAPVTNFTVPGKVADAADAINKLMLADHWQPFVAPFSSNPKLPDFVVTRFKKGSSAMEVDVSAAPAMSDATFVAYTGLINQNDLPFPVDATDIQFDSARPYLACATMSTSAARALSRRRRGLRAAIPPRKARVAAGSRAQTSLRPRRAAACRSRPSTR